jgi:F-type H+-transporting ATPase subunit epsilon
MMKVCIMAPDRVFLDVEAEELILPTNTGQIGILPNHTPLLTGLDIGVLLLREKTQWVSMAVMGGFALVQKNTITLLVNEAEVGTNIVADEAKQVMEDAKKPLIKLKGKKKRLKLRFNYSVPKLVTK